LWQVHGVGEKVARAISGFDIDRATNLELAQKEDISLSLLIGFRHDTSYSNKKGMTTIKHHEF
jgi:hypothetical protein